MNAPYPKLLVSFALAVLAGLPNAVGAAVFRCPGDDGAPRFSQFPCSTDRPASVVHLEPLHTVEIPPISDAEQELLEHLEQRRDARRERRSRQRQKALRQAADRREERREHCRAARQALSALEQQRRKGYSLSQARSLDRRERALEDDVRRNC
ncbi:MAG: hypothetical protein U5Q16_01060 [Gammaproteobacteria bacterium]|nr:hypothetical protein [Gammaproteobacteria bacterium]